jgi:hypothetical protein
MSDASHSRRIFFRPSAIIAPVISLFINIFGQYKLGRPNSLKFSFLAPFVFAALIITPTSVSAETVGEFVRRQALLVLSLSAPWQADPLTPRLPT